LDHENTGAYHRRHRPEPEQTGTNVLLDRKALKLRVTKGPLKGKKKKRRKGSESREIK